MPTLFKGGLVFDGERAPLPGHGVLVEDGRIARFAPLAEFDGFAGETVDTGGATLMPGLTDCHVHLCLGAEGDPGTAADKLLPGQLTLKALERAQAALAGGVTGLRDCGGKNHLELAVRDACNGGRMIGPSIRCSGKVICMTGGHGSRTARIADGVDEVIRAVREQIHAGADLIKIMATGGVMTPNVSPEDAHYTPEEMRAGVGEAKRFAKSSASHAQGAQGILNAVRAGVDSIEHGIFMTDECVAEMLARGTYLVPTLAAVKNILDAKAQIPAYIVEKAERVAERHKLSVQTFYKAGGRIALGTDAGTPFNPHGENARELEYMVDVGIAPLDALRFGASAAADLTGLAGEGRIADGAWADLLLVAGDPAADIHMAARRENHRMVLKRGVRVSGQSLALGFAAPSRMAAF
jgi:imidazolonepropionase-like amidohydrolase